MKEEHVEDSPVSDGTRYREILYDMTRIPSRKLRYSFLANDAHLATARHKAVQVGHATSFLVKNPPVIPKIRRFG
jgi:hypothetical protein